MTDAFLKGMPPPRVTALALIAALASCTPEMNWRNVAVTASGLQALFPCKPESSTRRSAPPEAASQQVLLSCKAGGATFAVAHADVGDATQASRVLAAMRTAVAANAGGGELSARAVQVPGMSDNPAAQRIQVRGRGVDRAAVDVQAVLFARGSEVFQASVVSRGSVPDEVTQSFFDGLRWPAGRR